MNIGRAIKVCRAYRGMSQGELGRAAGFSPSYISVIESGKQSCIMSVTADLARALSIPFFLLLFLASDDGELSSTPETVRNGLTVTALRLLNANGVKALEGQVSGEGSG